MLLPLRYLPIWALLCLFGCRAAKKSQHSVGAGNEAVSISPEGNSHADSMAFMEKLFQEVKRNQAEPETFSAKISVDFTEADGKRNQINAFLRMKKDSLVWISINAALGIEAFRILITPDSVKVLDKLNKSAKLHSFSYLQEITRLPFSFQNLQDLLLGNPVFVDGDFSSYSMEPGQVALLHTGEWYRNLLTISADPYLLQNSRIEDKNTPERMCTIAQSRYEKKNGWFFPLQRNILLAEKSRIIIDLDFKQYVFNEALSYPFTVPKNYSLD